MKTKNELNKNNERREIKFTLYVNTIGKKADEIMDEVKKAYPWYSNPKVVKTSYGSFRARKYSYLLSPTDFYECKRFIRERAIRAHGKEIHCLSEDKQNIFIIDRIEF